MILFQEEEKRRQKEEERRIKEEQKIARKLKKREPSRGAAPAVLYGGSALEDMVQGEHHLVPLFVELCIEFIEADGLSTEGLYRVPGNMAQVQQLMERFREGEGHTRVFFLILLATN